MQDCPKIIVVITDGDYGDVSFQDEYSAKVFDNVLTSMYGGRLSGIVDLKETQDSDWHHYAAFRASGKITHTLEYHIPHWNTEAVVEMLESMYDVTIIDIESED